MLMIVKLWGSRYDVNYKNTYRSGLKKKLRGKTPRSIVTFRGFRAYSSQIRARKASRYRLYT